MSRAKTRRAGLLAVTMAVMVGFMPNHAGAGTINSDVAFTPYEGGSVLRLYYTFSEADASGDVRNVHSSMLRMTYAYGLRQNLALFVTAPYLNRQVDRLAGGRRIEDAHDGVGDVTVLAKYRFWQNDVRPGETMRWAVLGGLNIRSGDSAFSSDSYDPIIGSVFTWQRDRNLFDTVLMHQFNTGGGKARHDVLRYDVAYSYRLHPAVFGPDARFEWSAVAEVNGIYRTDGSHEVYLSPGLQLISERFIVETSIQLPVVMELAGGPETDYRLVFGVRFKW